MLRRSKPPKGTQPLPRVKRVTSPSQTPIESLHLTVMRRLDGLLAGDHAGLFPGHGTERGEARLYVPGDDPRHIDWAVTARNHEPHVRDTIADHELDLWLIMDSSSSLGFGTAKATKHEVAWSAAGAFGLLASSSGNRVGAVRTTPHREQGKPVLLPAKAGSAHMGAILAALNVEPREGEVGDLAGSIDRVSRVAPRRGMVVLVADFLGSTSWEKPLRALAQRHEIVAVEVVDPREVELTDVGLIAVADPETGKRRLVDTSRANIREAYAAAAAEARSDVAKRLRRSNADHLVLWTDRDWVIDFVRFVAGRKARLLSSGRTG